MVGKSHSDQLRIQTMMLFGYVIQVFISLFFPFSFSIPIKCASYHKVLEIISTYKTHTSSIDCLRLMSLINFLKDSVIRFSVRIILLISPQKPQPYCD